MSARRKFGPLAVAALLAASPAHASIFHGETLDAIADVMAWIVLFVAPIAAIGVFLMVHILPEKIAEKRQHPQLSAIKTLCILSLFFGGMLWPFAWLWAYTKPVMHKLAYGTDVDKPRGPDTERPRGADVDKPRAKVPAADDAEYRIVSSRLERVRVEERDMRSGEG